MLFGQFARILAGLAQRRFWIAATERVNQALQIFYQIRIFGDGLLASAARLAHAPDAPGRPIVQILPTVADSTTKYS
jgi:hypothetical protein